MKLDWQHVVLIAVGLGCVTAVIVLGKGQLLVQLFAGLGGISGVLALLKRSPSDTSTSNAGSAQLTPKDGAS